MLHSSLLPTGALRASEIDTMSTDAALFALRQAYTGQYEPRAHHARTEAELRALVRENAECIDGDAVRAHASHPPSASVVCALAPRATLVSAAQGDPLGISSWRRRASHKTGAAIAERAEVMVRALQPGMRVYLRHVERHDRPAAGSSASFAGIVAPSERASRRDPACVRIVTEGVDRAWRANDASRFRMYDLRQMREDEHSTFAGLFRSTDEAVDRAIQLDVERTTQWLARDPEPLSRDVLASMVLHASCATSRVVAAAMCINVGRAQVVHAATCVVAMSLDGDEASGDRNPFDEPEEGEVANDVDVATPPHKRTRADDVIERLWIEDTHDDADIARIAAHLRGLLESLERTAAKRRCIARGT